MARKDKPYLPLYVQDFMTDEKLMECSAMATGVYVRIMCILHKCDTYGKILLKQKDKQNDNQNYNFALRFAKHLPYDFATILDSITELIDEGCLTIEGDSLFQKRMLHDGELSIKRSNTGSSGGKATQKKNKEFAKAKPQANADNDIDIVLSITPQYSNGLSQFLKIDFEERKVTDVSEQKYFDMVVKEMNKVWMKHKPQYSFMQEADYPALLRIAYLIGQRKNISRYEVVHIQDDVIIKSFDKISAFMASTQDKFFKKLTLDGLAVPKNFQKIEEAMRTNIDSDKLKQLESQRIEQDQYFKESL